MAARIKSGRKRRMRRGGRTSTFSPISFLWGCVAGSFFALFFFMLVRNKFETHPLHQTQQVVAEKKKRQRQPIQILPPALNDTEKIEMANHIALGIWSGGDKYADGTVSFRVDGTAHWHGNQATWRPMGSAAANLLLQDPLTTERYIDFIISKKQNTLYAKCDFDGREYNYQKVTTP